MIKSKAQIVTELGESFNSLCEAGRSISDNAFNVSENNKWTPAENLAHLVKATKITSLAFTLPKLVHIILYGKPNRTSHGYNKVVENYLKKLDAGAVASGAYVPKRLVYKKDDLTKGLNKEGEKLIMALDKKWNNDQLDQYQISHPILGLLTVRELAYFTIYHNSHHLKAIQVHLSS
jgi:hypothetical protein